MVSKFPRLLIFAFVTAIVSIPSAQAQQGPRAAPTTAVQVQQLGPAQPLSPPPQKLDAEKATNAYLARISGPARARSDAYYEGGYWLLLADTAYAVVVAALLLWLGLSAKLRDFTQRITRLPFLQTAIYAAVFFAIVTIATLPLTVYEGFFREHAYGLSNQDFGAWSGDFGKTFLLGLIAVTIVLTLVYAGIRATQRYWWIWATAISLAFFAIATLIYPVYIAPLFNTYTPLPDTPLKQQILSMAKANGVPADNVYVFDASRQSDRISANVSGLFGTTRISLNDNLLKRATPAEIEAVLGHEIGHYVLDHIFTSLLWTALVLVVGFAFLHGTFRLLTARFGARWGVKGIGDPAGLPVFYAMAALYLLLATPATNSITRSMERQADIFGLNAARQPDAFATVSLKLSEYRKLDPSPLEELLFYDHPSGRSRIAMAMRWKAQHLKDPDIKAGPVSPQ